jgi:hypothetical protein
MLTPGRDLVTDDDWTLRLLWSTTQFCAAYLPSIPFNNVQDRALKPIGLASSAFYVAQAFHPLPTRRSETIPADAIDISFDTTTSWREEKLSR